MTLLNDVLQQGDIVAIRSSDWFAKLIRLGQELQGKPNLDNHIAIAHHPDASGKFWWLLEGRPGGVGWADSRLYAGSPYLLNNCGQPGRTPAQRIQVGTEAQYMVGSRYDWEAIADDTLRTFHMADLFASTWNGKVPGHVVCSSYAAFLYERQGWARPTSPDRDTEPGDWDEFILNHGYNVQVTG